MRLIEKLPNFYNPHFFVWCALIENLSVIDYKLIKTECKLYHLHL